MGKTVECLINIPLVDWRACHTISRYFVSTSAPPSCATRCDPNILEFIADLCLPRKFSSAHMVDLITDNHSVERLGPDDHAQLQKSQSVTIISVDV